MAEVEARNRIASEWREFAELVFPGAGADQLSDLELAFYGGLFAVLPWLLDPDGAVCQGDWEALYTEARLYCEKRLARWRAEGLL